MSLFKSTKKIISSSILVLILFGLFTPFLSFAQNQNTASPTATQEKYYYYPLLDQKNFSDKTACNKEYTDYANSLLSTFSIQKLFDANDESKRVVCFNDSKNANNFFYYKPGSKSSTKFQDEKSCEDSSKKDRESKYKTVIDAWNNYFGTTLGKTISITDLPSLWSCTLVDQTKISAEEKAKIETNYYPLALLPGLGEECTPDSTGNTICIKVASDCHQDPKNPKEQICTPGLGFAGYLNIMINLIIGICAVLAMIMIVMGGIQYMTSELVSSKQAAKESITNAILGLLLALGAFALLNTINPNLLDIGLGNLPTATVEVDGEQGINSSTITTVDATGQTITLNVCDVSQLKSIKVFDGRTANVNISIANSLQGINQAWENGGKQYKVDDSKGGLGSYCCRNVRNKDYPETLTAGCGTREQMVDPTCKKIGCSAHSFGLAIDINNKTNPMSNPLKTDMPSSFISLFTSKGWAWGGNFKRTKDSMHFSAWSEEGGNISVTGTSTGGSTSIEEAKKATYRIKTQEIAITIKKPWGTNISHKIVVNDSANKKLFEEALSYETLDSSKTLEIWKTKKLSATNASLLFENGKMKNLKILVYGAKKTSIGTLNLSY